MLLVVVNCVVPSRQARSPRCLSGAYVRNRRGRIRDLQPRQVSSGLRLWNGGDRATWSNWRSRLGPLGGWAESKRSGTDGRPVIANTSE
jgi:hypothetical protein